MISTRNFIYFSFVPSLLQNHGVIYLTKNLVIDFLEEVRINMKPEQYTVMELDGGLLMNGEDSDYVPTDGELKAAELARIKAETEEINKRLNLPWWYLKPSALLQAIVGGIVAASLVGAFMLDNFLKIHDLNKEVINSINEENIKLNTENQNLQIQRNQLEQERNQLQQERKTLIEKLNILTKEKQDLAARNQAEGREKEAKEARESAQRIQEKLDEQIKIQAESLIEGLKGDRRRESRKNLAQLYPKNPRIVGDSLANAIKENFDSYRITLGVLDALGKVEGGWRESSDLIEEVERLSDSRYREEPTFKKNLSEARKNFKQ